MMEMTYRMMLMLAQPCLKAAQTKTLMVLTTPATGRYETFTLDDPAPELPPQNPLSFDSVKMPRTKAMQTVF